MRDDRTDSLSNQDGDPREEQIAEVLCQYLDRLNSGERIEEPTVRLEHPDLADELLIELGSLERIPRDAGDEGPVGTLGDYTLLRQIGRGGMGVVYEAWQNSVDRQVALKELPAGIAADARAVTRFIREAKTAAQLKHPNVVAVHALGVDDNTP